MQKTRKVPQSAQTIWLKPDGANSAKNSLQTTIVSLASFDEGTMHRQCTGIVISNTQSWGTSILTSSDLHATSTGRYKHSLKIRVRLPNRRLIQGVMQYRKLPCRMLVVTTKHSPVLRAACFVDTVQVQPLAELFAVKRCYDSSELMARSGELTEIPDGVESEGFMFSTCGITATGNGGPLVDLDGNIVGMNCYDNREITPFVPRDRIAQCLGTCGFEPYDTRKKKSTRSSFRSEGSINRGSSSGGSENKKQEPCTPVLWSDLDQELASKLSPSVVSLASFNGETLHSECTGIFTDSSRLSSPTFLTSPSLYKSIPSERVLTMTVKVRLPNDQVVDGWVQDLMPSYNLLLIATDPLSHYPDLHLACLGNSVQAESGAEVLAVRRCFKSGKLMTSRGVMIDTRPSGAVSNALKLSTCKITEDASGGPLVDFDGNVVGMNCYDRGTTPYVPTSFICECFGRDMFCSGSNQDDCSTSRRSSNGIESSSTPNNSPKQVIDHVQQYPTFDPTRAELTDDDNLKRILDSWPCDDNDVFAKKVNKMLRDYGYPLPSFKDGGMYLKGDFEEKFGAETCSKSVERVASKMSQHIVALASFDDEGRRYFACSGILIECNTSTTRVLTSAGLVRTSGGENKIHKLRIEVCLPSKQCVPGALEHYDLDYNVAVVGFSGDSSHGAAKLTETTQTNKVVALGRGFRSGELMATDGVVTGERSRFDCEELRMSTCKITKAGIGGPLVDFDGNFVGLNFYDMENTPYLPRGIVLEFIGQLNAGGTAAAEVTKKPTNSNGWPVPEPYWVYPSRHRQPSYDSDGYE